MLLETKNIFFRPYICLNPLARKRIASNHMKTYACQITGYKISVSQKPTFHCNTT